MKIKPILFFALAAAIGLIALPVKLMPGNAADLPVEMVRAASGFLKSLGEEARERALTGFGSSHRHSWNYLPHGDSQPVGVSTGSLTESQREQGDRLLRSGMSAQGTRKAGRIVMLDDHLHEITGRGYSSGHYWYTVFGEPSGSAPWGWRFEGHHLSLNFTVTPAGVSATPMFLGANPAEVTSGPHEGLRTLAREYDLAVKLVTGLSAQQLERALISSETYGDIVFGMREDSVPFAYEGIPASGLDARQVEILRELIQTYTSNLASPLAEHYYEWFMRDGIEAIHFAWAGETAPGRPCYYRITSPRMVIEFDNSQQSADGNGYNHYHSVLREVDGDFGRDLLRGHYEKSPHHQR